LAGSRWLAMNIYPPVFASACPSLARRIYGPSSSPMKSVLSIGLPFNEPNCPKHKTQMILYPILNSGKKKIS